MGIRDRDNWIMADVFGQGGDAGKIGLEIQQDTVGGYILQSSGIVVANNDGEIFLEASGYDPSTRGFIEHRPYIQLVYGDVIYGTPQNDIIYLYTDGSVPPASSAMNLYTVGPDSAYVYNNMGLYVPSVLGIASGAIPSGLFLYLDSPPGVSVSGAIPSGMFLYTSGQGITNEQLNLRVRGK